MYTILFEFIIIKLMLFNEFIKRNGLDHLSRVALINITLSFI